MLRKSLSDPDNGLKGDWCFIGREIEVHDIKIMLEDYYIAIRWGDGIESTCVIPIILKWPDGVVGKAIVSYWTHEGKHAWEWNGSRDAPTLKPSILVHGKKDMPAQWHGFLTDGKLTTA